MLSRRELCLAALSPLAQGSLGGVETGSPFTLGVASGEPDARSVVLWTRLAPRPLQPGGGMPLDPVEVRWELWSADGRHCLRDGVTQAAREHAHSVHVLVEGLDPDTSYRFRFTTAGVASPIGTTRTLPAPESQSDSLCFATVCCQNYTQGRFTSYRTLLRAQPDFILHLGDYIYEVDFEGRVRPHPPSGPPRTLDDFRRWHAQYKTDADLAAAHAAVPFLLLVDNHDAVTDGDAPLTGLRQAAYQAWAEHMPVRSKAGVAHWTPASRGFSWGRLAHFELLDTRKARSRQDVCGARDGGDPGFGLYRRPCHEHLSSDRRLLDAADERGVLGRLDAARDHHSWIALASSVPMGGLPFHGGRRIYAPSWDAYPAARQTLLRAIDKPRAAGVVGLSGDIHAAIVSELRNDGRRVGFDLVTTSLTSSCPEPLAGPLRAIGGLAYRNPDLRGFSIHRLNATRWITDFYGRRVADTGPFSIVRVAITRCSAGLTSLALSSPVA